MKRFTYISLFILGLVLVSCNKEVIRPNQHNNAFDFCGNDDKGGRDGFTVKAIGDNVSTESSTNNSNNTNDSGEGTITDPNNDPDSVKRKGKG